MSKIVRAVNAMISDTDKINCVVKSGLSDYFFLFNNKYRWSIRSCDEGNYILRFYSTDASTKELANWDGEDWQYFNDFITYDSSDLGSSEAYQTFNALFTLVQEKELGIDKVLNDILQIVNDSQPEEDLPF